jgi:hypothetical protein
VRHRKKTVVADDAVMMSDHQSTGGLAYVDAVITVSGMADNPFVFLVKSVHGWPGERYPFLQFACKDGQVDVLPRRS